MGPGDAARTEDRMGKGNAWNGSSPGSRSTGLGAWKIVESGQKFGGAIFRDHRGTRLRFREPILGIRAAQRGGVCRASFMITSIMITSIMIPGIITPGDRIENLLSMNRYLFGRLDTKPHLVSTDLHHHDRDVVVDNDAFVLLPRQDKHGSILGSQGP